VLSELPHETFSRKGADLFLKRTVSLVEALLGFHFEVEHLDKQRYTFYTRPGDIVGDGHKKVVKGLGMPFLDEPHERGNLVIEFKVTMPKRG
jgi:DnaJ-class molecular chaperone